MASLITEPNFINNNAYKYEHILKSQLTKYIDRTPTFTTYYHINNNDSTVDDGYQDIESLLGSRSPLRFEKIKDFPIYGVEPINMQLQDQDQGLDMNYESEAIILPNTIKPLPNDFFTIDVVNNSYVFRVTSVEVDTIRPDNFFKIQYKLEHISDQRNEILNDKVINKFTCILDNIGTENNCIIEDEIFDKLSEIELMYQGICDLYISVFYNERYNTFILPTSVGIKIYDPLQIEFMNRHDLFNRPYRYKTLSISNEVNDDKLKLKYERSMYRYFEKIDNRLLTEFKYELYPAIYRKETCFARWYDNSVYITDLPNSPSSKSAREIFSPEFTKILLSNEKTDNFYVEFFRKYVHGEIESIYDIDDKLGDQVLFMEPNDEMFFMTPILLYVIKTITNSFLKAKGVKRGE